MRRFFIQPVTDHREVIALGREEARHCLRVLRLQPGDAVELIDGAGGLYRGTLEVRGGEPVVRLQAKVINEPEPTCPLWVCQGDLKGRKMDELVQRCTELGVTRFLPFTSSRCQGRIDRERWERKQERWQGLVRSACKQSRRLRIMEVERERPFAQRLEAPELPGSAMKLLFWEEERKNRLAELDWRTPRPALCLMLGPEGGFSAEEVTQARRYGWTIVSLGSRILRAETATPAAIAIVRHLLGEM